jgi:hypothetical protein
MKTSVLYLTCAVLFVLCCSMSQCRKNDTPGPETSVHGIIKDYNTGGPIANIRLIVTQDEGVSLLALDAPPQSRSYDTITTKTDGTYSYKFTPLGTGKFNLNILDNENYNYNYPSNPLIIGSDNEFDFTFQKLLNLNLHLVNNTAHNTTSGLVLIYGCCAPVVGFTSYFGVNIGPKKLDTLIHTKMAQLSTVSIECRFYNANDPNPPLSVIQSFKSGKNDTTVNVINP